MLQEKLEEKPEEEEDLCELGRKLHSCAVRRNETNGVKCVRDDHSPGE